VCILPNFGNDDHFSSAAPSTVRHTYIYIYLLQIVPYAQAFSTINILQKMMSSTRYILFITCCVSAANAFIHPPPSHTATLFSVRPYRVANPLRYTSKALDGAVQEALQPPSVGLIEAQITTHSLIVEEHKPLGCRVEESLVKDDSKGVGRQVFVARVSEGGNAERSGLIVGDVILQVSNVFGTGLTDVEGLGLERIRNLIAGADEEIPLHLTVRRGTSIKLRHDAALSAVLSDDVEGALDTIDLDNHDAIVAAVASVGQSIVTNDVAWSIHNDECAVDDPECCEDDNCALDMLWDAWGEEEIIEDVDEPVVNAGDDSNETEETILAPKKPAPWSSRSSPSGTWVRNPVTGKLEDIDENRASY